MKIQVLGPYPFSYSNGWSHEADDAVFVFGDRLATVSKFRETHANVGFSFLNQIHSDRRVLKGSSPITTDDTFHAEEWPEGDAHWTRERGVALCIRTADCAPVLITVPGAIAAIHAGWRGVEAEIIQKTLADMQSAGLDISRAQAVIGPHIGKASFEVGRDVAERLNVVFRRLRYNPAPISYPHATDENKRMIEMSTLIRAQLIQAGVDENAIGEIKADTFADLNLHSFRRERENSGRLISFVFLKPTSLA